MSLPPETLRIEPHADARSKAVASTTIRAGSVIISLSPLATSLLQSQKGVRCDLCHRQASEKVNLSRCSGCASYWYCSKECQNKQWKAHHKRLCKHYDRYVASAAFQGLFEGERTDAILLSHLLAERVPRNGPASVEPNDPSFIIFLDLMSDENLKEKIPPLCGDMSIRSREIQNAASHYFSRFGRNNFIVHSHLNSYAHGIFPLASRLFNHSCLPNAAAKYILTPHEPPRMEVISLRDIQDGEEVLINYLDPALPISIRDTALSINYGFRCTCSWCLFSRDINPQSPPPRETKEAAELETKLRTFVFGGNGDMTSSSKRFPLFPELPNELHPLLHEAYLPDLSEQFSSMSHSLQGNEDSAIMSGVTLLALYMIIYGPNYPQIGIHALELAKTAWNALILAGDNQGSMIAERETIVRACITLGGEVLGVWGGEGDEEGGPLEELEQLRNLVAN